MYNQRFLKFRWPLQRRHVFAKPPECHILASYQMWFCQKFLKNAKNYTKIVKIWRFFVKNTSGSTKIHNFLFLGVFNQFLAKNLNILEVHVCLSATPFKKISKNVEAMCCNFAKLYFFQI